MVLKIQSFVYNLVKSVKSTKLCSSVFLLKFFDLSLLPEVLSILLELSSEHLPFSREHFLVVPRSDDARTDSGIQLYLVVLKRGRL